MTPGLDSTHAPAETNLTSAAQAAGGALATNEAWAERYANAVMGVYGTPSRTLVRGEGCYVWDADGNRYLDLLAGIAVNVLGHANPTWVSAVCAQLGTLGQISNFFTSPSQIMLAERLLELTHAPVGSRVFLTNSGTEAIEGAFKIARRTGRRRILALEGAFHGRSMGALSLTHKAAYREPFEPLPGGVEHLPFGDLDALAAALGDGDVAALVLEPIQGEAGVRPLPPGYLQAARELTAEHGALLVLDEVQTGMGRTGTWFAKDHPHIGAGVQPDVIALAKGLGGGFPIGAVVALGEYAATLLGRGEHGTTFGGNPPACVAALATLHVMERDGVLAHVEDVSRTFRGQLAQLNDPLLAGVRGEGLLLAVELTEPVAPLVAEHALAAGFIVNPVQPSALRVAPPLVITHAQLASFADALPGILSGVRAASQGGPS